jgi:hypothetical protein
MSISFKHWISLELSISEIEWHFWSLHSTKYKELNIRTSMAGKFVIAVIRIDGDV